MKNTVLLAISSLLEKGASFIFLSLLAYNYGKHESGEYSYYFALANILFLVFNLGGDTYTVRYFVKKSTSNMMLNIVFSKFILFGVTILAVVLFNRSGYLLILLISFFLESVISIMRSYLFFEKRFTAQAFYLIAEKVCFVTLVLLNIVSCKNVILLYLAFVLSKLFVIIYFVLKENSLKQKINLRIDFKELKDFLFNSWSYLFLNVFLIISAKIGIIFMKVFDVGFDNIGLYFSSLNIIMACMILPDVLFKQYYPIVTKHIKNDNFVSLAKITNKIQIASLTFSSLIAITIALFSKEIITIVFSKSFVEAYKILILLSSMIVIRFLLRVHTAIVASSNKSHYRFTLSILAAISSFILNFIFISKWALTGAIVANILVEITLFALYKCFSVKISKESLFSKVELIGLMLIGLLILIFCYYESIPVYSKIIYLIFIISGLFVYKKKIRLLLSF